MSCDDVQYTTGQLDFDIPFFDGDAVIIRGYGAYSLSTTAFQSGSVPINCASSLADLTQDAANPISDLVYLVQNDLSKLPVKRTVLMVHWYNGFTGSVPMPAVLSSEVTAPGVPVFTAGAYTATTAVPMPPGSQIFPTVSDASLVDGMNYLMANGYAVGICPVSTIFDPTHMFPVDRASRDWTDPAAFATFLAAYTTFVKHYCDLCVANSITPWIFYIGYGLWDLTFNTPDDFFTQWVATLEALAIYAKAQLPLTLITYAADVDEYFVDYEVTSQFRLDALWSSPAIDLIGINWFAPLSLTYLNDPIELRKGVLGNEAYSFLVNGYDPRSTDDEDRFLSHSHEAGKTGIPTTPLANTQGYKNIGDFLSMGHFIAAASAVVSSASPLPGNTLASLVNSGPVIGTGTTVSNIGMSSGAGGLAPIPALGDTYLNLEIGQTVFLSMAAGFSSPVFFDFQFVFDVSAFGTLTNFTLCQFASGLSLFYSGGNLCVSVPTTGAPVVQILTSAALASVEVQTSATQVVILVDSGIAATLTGAFVFPVALEHLSIGGNWSGQVSFVSVAISTSSATYGGNYFFDESYAGTRTSWMPEQKGFMATAVGYPSISYGCVEPSTAIITFLEVFDVLVVLTPTVFPPWFTDVVLYQNATYRIPAAAGSFPTGNTAQVTDIQGPYGSTFIVDEQHQAICMDAVFTQLHEKGAQYCVGYYCDTRSADAMLYQVNGKYIFNDALAFRYAHAFNSKATVRFNGSDRTQVLQLPSVDERLGLSTIPAPPKVRLSISCICP